MRACPYPQNISAESGEWSSATSLAFISRSSRMKGWENVGMRWAAGTPSV